MPEEQAFCVLLKLMYDYGLREFYKDGFETVYLKLYQLNKLMEVSCSLDWFIFLLTLIFIFHLGTNSSSFQPL